MNKVNFFLVGAPKCGTSWIHQCFLEHPEICTSKEDTIQYFNINIHYQSLDWYHDWFNQTEKHKVIADLTPSYYRDTAIAKRIFDYNPEAKICFAIRNPIDRAFSQYWHKKSKKRITYTFNETLERKGHGYHDLFYEFIQPGFYHELMQPYIQLFPASQIKIVLFDDLTKNAKGFIQDLYEFAGADREYVPSFVNNTVNSASKNYKSKSNLKARLSDFSKTGNVKQLLVPPIDEYKKGMDSGMREKLRAIFQQPNKDLASFIKRDLSHWK